jgi:murein DD-endopeptidase MepM/ murein hydrolase activator NlpD
VPLLIGVVAIVGVGSVVARNLPILPAAGPSLDPNLVGAVAASGSPSVDGQASSPAGGVGTPERSQAPTPAPAPTPTPVPTAPPITALTGYRWPLPNGRLTLPFGPSPWGSRIVDGQHFHDGVDLATFCGDRIVAAHAGTVLAAGRRYDDAIGWVGDLARYKARLDRKALWPTLPIVIIIDNGDGFRSIYAHFSKVVVKKGDVVAAGDFLGFEGMTGRASGCHLHYGMFSPLEMATFGIDPVVAKRMLLPGAQVARIDPLLVLPPRPQDQPSAAPSSSATASSRPGPAVPTPSIPVLPIPYP